MNLSPELLKIVIATRSLYLGVRVKKGKDCWQFSPYKWTLAGAQFGTVVTLPVSGWLCDTDFLGGWPSVFYVFGALGIVWSLVWFLLVSDRPDIHPRISQEEKQYILRHCAAKTQVRCFLSH